MSDSMSGDQEMMDAIQTFLLHDWMYSWGEIVVLSTGIRSTSVLFFAPFGFSWILSVCIVFFCISSLLCLTVFPQIYCKMQLKVKGHWEGSSQSVGFLVHDHQILFIFYFFFSTIFVFSGLHYVPTAVYNFLYN